MSEKTEKKENGLVNVIFNIALPVIILNSLSEKFGENGPKIALVVALAFPIAYGMYDYIQRKKKNLLSALGIINVLFTGGLALLKLEGFWFAVKEASFPLIIGLVVLVSAFTSKPLFSLMFMNDAIMDTQKINKALAEKNAERAYNLLLKKSTYWFSASFFLSAILNYVLARYIFTNIDPNLSELEHTQVLNEQIADMTWISFLVLALPLTLFMFVVMMYFFKQLKTLTNLDWQEVLKTE